jgi:hypothetical protein
MDSKEQELQVYILKPFCILARDRPYPLGASWSRDRAIKTRRSAPPLRSSRVEKQGETTFLQREIPAQVQLFATTQAHCTLPTTFFHYWFPARKNSRPVSEARFVFWRTTVWTKVNIGQNGFYIDGHTGSKPRQPVRIPRIDH